MCFVIINIIAIDESFVVVYHVMITRVRNGTGFMSTLTIVSLPSVSEVIVSVRGNCFRSFGESDRGAHALNCGGRQYCWI